MSFVYSVPSFAPRRRDLVRNLLQRRRRTNVVVVPSCVPTLPLVSSFYGEPLPVASEPLPEVSESLDQVVDVPLDSMPVTDVPAPTGVRAYPGVVSSYGSVYPGAVSSYATTVRSYSVAGTPTDGCPLCVPSTSVSMGVNPFTGVTRLF